MRSKRKRILLFYSSRNSGHYKASVALRTAFGEFYPQVETVALEFFESVYSKIGRGLINVYPRIIKSIPHLWRLLYDNQDLAEATEDIRKLFNWLCFGKVEKILAEYTPEAIVCTQAAPCHVASAYKKEKGNGVPLIGVITDYLVHPYWIQDKVDLYIVPTGEVRATLMERGIPAEKIREFGIPIDPRFSLLSEKEEKRVALGLSRETPTLLVTGGSMGMIPMEKILNSLSQVSMRFQVIVVTGRNKRLWTRIKKREKEYPFAMKLLGYTEWMDVLMDASDLIITKPGGLTSAEALAKGLPLVIVKPMPGQEERNGRYLIDQGAGVWVENLKDLSRIIEGLLSCPGKIQEMRQKARLLARPEAARESVKAIMELVE